jgi:hypothetical protein
VAALKTDLICLGALIAALLHRWPSLGRASLASTVPYPPPG